MGITEIFNEIVFPLLGIIVGVALGVVAGIKVIAKITPGTKDDEWALKIDQKLEDIVNRLERLTNKDLDGDGDVGQKTD